MADISHGKNVTVFDKIVTQTMENTQDGRDKQLITPTKKMTLGLESAVGNLDESINYAASQESVHRITDQVLTSNLILSEN